jgi:hypothetical protein
MTRGDKGQTVPYGTIPRRRVPRHFMPGYPHSAPSGQQAKDRFEKARSFNSPYATRLLWYSTSPGRSCDNLLDPCESGSAIILFQSQGFVLAFLSPRPTRIRELVPLFQGRVINPALDHESKTYHCIIPIRIEFVLNAKSNRRSRDRSRE